ncbi:hypothetical protein H5410_025810 [Solanum commersonii]|uniref:Uncharacterized protein n=1 Tax=Solanum commersonii TaxID=4109 RepID=A0A9J5YZL5_SOLCO|nr:hypothetical protein H5410_025810 [Solanum commersonii]
MKEINKIVKVMLLIRLLGEEHKLDGWIFMPHLWKLCNNLVKVLKSRRMDLHATFMQVVQQLGEGVEIEEIGNPTTEVIASKQSSTTNHPRVYCVGKYDS